MPLVATILDGAPAADVMLTTAGLSFETVMLRLLTPTALPSVHVPTDVDGALLFAGAPATDPPPAVTVIVTGTPLIGFPSWSFTTNDGDVVSGSPAAGVPLGCAVISIDVGIAFGPEESPQANAAKGSTATNQERIMRGGRDGMAKIGQIPGLSRSLSPALVSSAAIDH